MSLFEVLYTIILCDVQTAIVKLKSDFYKECPHTAAPSSMCQIKIHMLWMRSVSHMHQMWILLS